MTGDLYFRYDDCSGLFRPGMNELDFAGSLLVAAAHRGAFVLGADIDYQVLHGKGVHILHLSTVHNF